MTKTISYNDAVKILGKNTPGAVAAIDNVLGGAVLIAGTATGTAGALGPLKAELVRQGGVLLGRIGQRVRGARGYSRIELLLAAHSVAVVTAFFDAMPDVTQKEVGLSDQLGLIGSKTKDRRNLAEALLESDVPAPLPHVPREAFRKYLRSYYRGMADEVLRYAKGLAMWDAMNETEQSRFAEDLKDNLPNRALKGFEGSILKLSEECPQFEMWTLLGDHEATRWTIGQAMDEGFDAINTALNGLELALARLSDNPIDSSLPQRLSLYYRQELQGPIAEGDDPAALAGIRMPTSHDAYINPSCRIGLTTGATQPSSDTWWEAQAIVPDIQEFLKGYLTSPAAVDGPVVILGQPGAGKSLLTKVLAAKLPAADYMPVRVKLRQVNAEDSIQDQVEAAILEATGDSAAWPRAVASAGGALPLILLDGFDELLQATGVSQSNYLEQVRQFQHRESLQGRPVIAVVTSRTVVADRVRYPDGTAIVRLEPFTPRQIEAWLSVWTTCNHQYYLDHNLRPLDVETACRQIALASQPLLLLMLALYDADGNALHQDSRDLDQNQLYERLLQRFVTREINKSDKLDREPRDEAVEAELDRLSIVAFSMFNRGRTFASAKDVDADLEALLRAPSGVTRIEKFNYRYTDGELAFGRFFFVHVSSAISGSVQARTYEFLHSTFGEYLIARMIVNAIEELAAQGLSARPARTHYSEPDDSWLFGILSWAPLTDRAQILIFMANALRQNADQLHEVLLRLFIRADTRSHLDNSRRYEPIDLTSSARLGIYKVNLVILLCAAGTVLASDLFPKTEDPAPEWQSVANLWRSALTWSSWGGLIREIAVTKLPIRNGRRDMLISFTEEAPASLSPAELWDWWHGGGGVDPGWDSQAEDAAFMTQMTPDILIPTVEKLQDDTRWAIEHYAPEGPSIAALMLDLTFSAEEQPRRIIDTYHQFADAISSFTSPREIYIDSDPRSIEFFRQIYRRLAADAPKIPVEELLEILSHMTQSFGESTVYPQLAAIQVLLQQHERLPRVLLESLISSLLWGLLPMVVGGEEVYMDYLVIWLSVQELGLDLDVASRAWERSDLWTSEWFSKLLNENESLQLRLVHVLSQAESLPEALLLQLPGILSDIPAHLLGALSDTELEFLASILANDDIARLRARRESAESSSTVRLARLSQAWDKHSIGRIWRLDSVIEEIDSL